MLNSRVATNDEIVGTARAIVETYGDGAFIEANRRAKKMWQLGDDESYNTWSRIAAYIEKINGRTADREQIRSSGS